MKKLYLLCLLLPVMGCLTSSSPNVVYWTIDNAVDQKLVQQSKYGIVRVSQVVVHSPYDGDAMAVLRSDGSIAFDGFNHFAAPPSSLLRGAVIDIVRASGYFSNVVGQSSAVIPEFLLECEFSEIAISSRGEEGRRAEVAVELRLLDRSYRILKRAFAMECCTAVDGNYARAFSIAYSNAMNAALREF